MTTLKIFKDFKPLHYFINKYRRSGMYIWDANLAHGDVRPFACPELVCEGSGDHRYIPAMDECYCGGFDFDTEVVDGFCGNQYFYINSSGVLVQGTANEVCDHAGCRAGVPVPRTPSVSGSCGPCDGVGVSYFITHVSLHAGIEVEGSPSPASVIVPSAGDTPGANVSWGAPPAGFCVVATNVYRCECTYEDGTGQVPHEGAEFVFVRRVNGGGGGGFGDGVPSCQTGAPCVTHNPMAFPATGGLISLARTVDGIAVATEHQVFISEAGQPQFTWDGVVDIEDRIIAIRAINNNIFVFTDKKPVKLGYRIADQRMVIDKQVVSRHLPLVSRRSLSVHGKKIFFASTYSLYSWDTGGYGDDLTSQIDTLIAPEQYKMMRPETIVGTAYEFGYIFSSDSMRYSLMVELGEDGTDNALLGTSIMPITYIPNPTAFAQDRAGHIVYSMGGNFYKWDYRKDTCKDYFDIDENGTGPACNNCECCKWTIGIYHDNEGKNKFRAMRVEWDMKSAESIDLNYSYWDFGNISHPLLDTKVINCRGFGIPKFSSSQTSLIRLQGCAILQEVRLATSFQELTGSYNMDGGSE